MHLALRIEEILLKIFRYCDPATFSRYLGGRRGTDLAAFARTCRAFRDPALDVLWSVLTNLTPLIRCLPEVSREDSESGYGFTRPLEPAELDILRGYARRIWSLNTFNFGLDWGSIGACVDIPPTEPLFPNLRSIDRCFFSQEAAPWLSLPFPSLRILHIYQSSPGDHCTFQALFESFAKSSPHVERVSIKEFKPDFAISKQVSNQIRCWSNLKVLNCCSVALDIDALRHLSSMPKLRDLGIRPDSAARPDPATVIHLPSLDSFRFLSAHLAPMSRILSCLRLPLLTMFNARFSFTPSRREWSAFLKSVERCGMGHKMQDWELTQMLPYKWEGDSDIDDSDVYPEHRVLGLHDLYPFMAFTDLRRLQLNLRWAIGLTDHDLLVLGQAWPKLGDLDINPGWGWRYHGVTPHGLAAFVRRFPSVELLGVAIDTRGFTALPASLAQWSSSSLPSSESPHTAACRIDLLDSRIEDPSVPAMAALFAALGSHRDIRLAAWDDYRRQAGLELEVYSERWTRVRVRAKEAIEARRLECGVVRYNEPRRKLE